jgi:hypothetical protein
MTNERLTELYQEALDVQYACNLCGLAQTFAARIKEILHDTNITANANQHLLVTLWLDKMLSLNQYDDKKVSLAYSEAFKYDKPKECRHV